MKLRKMAVAAIAATAFSASLAATVAAAADKITILNLSYRTGAYAPNGVPFANGMKDYVTLLNERNGGIGGAKINYIECETGYNTKVGVECYEKHKSDNPIVVIPNSTGITYQLIPKSPVDKIALLTIGYGRTSAAVGSVFPWVFNFPATYWSQATAVVRYMGTQVGGLDKLKGKHIAHIYHNSAYGKEANPTLEALSKKHGFKLTLLAVDHPGQEQKATWLQIRRKKPDFIFMSGWGVMNQVAIKSAAEIKFPMDRFIGNWWSGTETDVAPAAAGANGYKSATFHNPGRSDVHKDLKKYVYDAGKGAGEWARTGEVLYIRGMVNIALAAEGIARAQKAAGKAGISGDDLRKAFNNFKVDAADWKRIGLLNQAEISTTCNDHEGAKGVRFQQWDAKAKEWKIISDWVPVMRDVVRPMMEADAAKFAKENNITPANCG